MRAGIILAALAVLIAYAGVHTPSWLLPDTPPIRMIDVRVVR